MGEIKLWPQRAHEAEAEVARLRAEDSYQKMLLEQAKGTILNLRAEVEKSRVDAERYRVIRSKVGIVGGKSKAEFRILNLDPRYLAPKASIELDAAIDAAMGEGK